LDLEFYYQIASERSLPDTAPEEVKKVWNTARNLLVYSYFEQSFFVASDLYCAMTVELTMRLACPDEIAEEKIKREKRGFVDWEPWCSAGYSPKFKEDSRTIKCEELEFLFSSLVRRIVRNDLRHPRKHAVVRGQHFDAGLKAIAGWRIIVTILKNAFHGG
jgi:hypothetical protein